MKIIFEGKEKILEEFRSVANSPFYDPQKATQVQADAIVLKTILEIRDLLIVIYNEMTDKVTISGREPS